MLRWEIGSVLPKDIHEHLSGPEVTFFSSYSRLLGSYSASLNLDLTAVRSFDMQLMFVFTRTLQYAQPPKELFVEVRCLEDVGEIVTESGSIILKKNSQVTSYI